MAGGHTGKILRAVSTIDTANIPSPDAEIPSYQAVTGHKSSFADTMFCPETSGGHA